MTKNELASYLVSLHTLIDAQTKGSHSVASVTLMEEYNKYWDLLKEAIQEENDDETRQAKLQRSRRPEDSADIQSGEPSRGISDRSRRPEGTNVPRIGAPVSDEE